MFAAVIILVVRVVVLAVQRRRRRRLVAGSGGSGVGMEGCWGGSKIARAPGRGGDGRGCGSDVGGRRQKHIAVSLGAAMRWWREENLSYLVKLRA